jgi:hypothetical protein
MQAQSDAPFRQRDQQNEPKPLRYTTVKFDRLKEPLARKTSAGASGLGKRR